MLPILFTIFGEPVAAWYVFFALAMLAAYFATYFLLTKAKSNLLLQNLSLLFIAAYISGFLGARGLSIITEGPLNPQIVAIIRELFSLGSLTFYGGILGGGAAVVTIIICKKLPFPILLDIAAIAIILGLGVGRIGCFLNGCDYGKPIPLQEIKWWAYQNPILADNLQRYPTQLEEALFSLLLAGVGVIFFLGREKKEKLLKPNYGILGIILLLIMAAHRYINEIFRDDFRGFFFKTNFTTSQGISLVLIIALLGLSLFLKKRERKN